MKQSIVLAPGRPLPRADEASAPFFEALKQRQLLVQVCVQCGCRQIARRRCIACSSPRLDWAGASGRGVVVSFAIVHANGNENFNAGEPYNIAIVELAEGPQLYTNIVDADAAELRIGMPVTVVYSELESGAVAPVFAPA